MNRVGTIIIFTDTHKEIHESLFKNLGRRYNASLVVFKMDDTECTKGRYVRGKTRMGRPSSSKLTSITLSVDAVQRILKGTIEAKREFRPNWVVIVTNIKEG